MKTLKTIMALVLALALVSALFVPVFATGENTDPTEESKTEETKAEETKAEEPTQAPGTDADDKPAETKADETPAAAEFKMAWEENVAQILEYGKPSLLGKLTLGECSLVKWYVLNEDGSVYNQYSVKDHHEGVINITWTGLDKNGYHPAGKWNAPTAVRFSIVIVATDIKGVDHVDAEYFTYNFFDSEKTAPANGAAGTKGGDVPHTGL